MTVFAIFYNSLFQFWLRFIVNISLGLVCLPRGGAGGGETVYWCGRLLRFVCALQKRVGIVCGHLTLFSGVQRLFIGDLSTLKIAVLISFKNMEH